VSARLLSLTLALACAASVQAGPPPVASAHGRAIAWAWGAPHGDATLRVADAAGEVREFALGPSLRWSFEELELPDGQYRYELSVAPPGAAQRRAPDAHEGAVREGGALQSGSFTLAAGRIVEPQPEPAAPGKKGAALAKDAVVADDRIVQGSACIGLDCVNGVDFAGHTLRLAENNTRLHFEDTSVGPPNADWELTANDSPNGGANSFTVLQRNSGLPVLRLLAEAPDGSLRVGASGHLGIATATPQQRFHVTGLDGPTLRLDQSNAGGFTAYTWDLFGDETRFGVRDVPAGQVAMQIARGTPTGTLTLAPQARVGVGNPAPATTLHVMRSDGTARLRVEETSAAPVARTLLELVDDGAPAMTLQGAQGGWTLDAAQALAMGSNLAAAGTLQLADNGDLVISGSLSQGSSRALKQAIDAVAPARVLEKIVALPLYAWQYRADAGAARHVGPMAEDVFAAFGLGVGARSLAPGDVAGLAIAATQALQAELAARDAELDALLARLDTLEAAAGARP
jgi:hypothetical protein